MYQSHSESPPSETLSVPLSMSSALERNIWADGITDGGYLWTKRLISVIAGGNMIK